VVKSMQYDLEADEKFDDPDNSLIYECKKAALDNRYVIMNGLITENAIETVWLQCELLKIKEEKEPIDLYINSPGGDAQVSMFISDYIRSGTCAVRTIGIGECCSGAFIILVSGLKRYCYKNTTLMMHNISAGIVDADAKSTLSHAKNLEDLWRRILKLLSEQSNLSEKEIEAKINEEREWYISSEQALEYGWVDEIIEPKFTYRNRKSWDKKTSSANRKKTAK